MKKTIVFFVILAIFSSFGLANIAYSAGETSGYILLQVQKNGEAWYVYPGNGERYFLGRPDDSFAIMKKLALGAKHDFITNTKIFPARLSGLILLDTERNGEAYYIYPKDNKKYFLGRPADAFRIMSELGQGISNSNLKNIPIGNIADTTSTTANKNILLSVPFTSQAPFGGWSDLRQEDGCEEASSLMAVSWAREQSFTKQEALNKILGSSDYTLKKYGEYRDLSATDTLNWVIKDYFNYQKAIVKKNITVDDIINELKNGHVVIAPMNGQLLGNPTHHMMVIRGYDQIKKMFITNDPGTRKGELYEYDKNVFFEAIRDYKTGFQEPDTTVEKNIIVVSK
jgi:hypothetical protein